MRLATAVTLARAGHTVYATMRNAKTGGEELRAIAEREHLPLHIAALDADSEESARNAFALICAPVDGAYAARLSANYERQQIERGSCGVQK
jgi:NAD(P)-dependent dehydrogenase (short-subunit alcohol dehydrogenase family)